MTAKKKTTTLKTKSIKTKDAKYANDCTREFTVVVLAKFDSVQNSNYQNKAFTNEQIKSKQILEEVVKCLEKTRKSRPVKLITHGYKIVTNQDVSCNPECLKIDLESVIPTVELLSTTEPNKIYPSYSTALITISATHSSSKTLKDVLVAALKRESSQTLQIGKKVPKFVKSVSVVDYHVFNQMLTESEEQTLKLTKTTMTKTQKQNTKTEKLSESQVVKILENNGLLVGGKIQQTKCGIVNQEKLPIVKVESQNLGYILQEPRPLPTKDRYNDAISKKRATTKK